MRSADVDPLHLTARSTAVCAALAAALLSVQCTSASTNLSGPSSDKCQTSVANAPSAFGPTGGSGSVTISTARDCTWSIAAEASWVAINGERTGQGDAVVAYAVSPNPVPAARSGALVVGSQRIQLTQAAAPCVFELNKSSDAIGAAGGALSVQVTTLTGCAWTAAAAVPWIAVTSGGGSASGTVALAVAANTGPARVGQVNVAGQSYTVTQAGMTSGPAPEPSPTPSPGPTPSPTPTPVEVDIEGTVSALSGRCPTVTFVVSSSPVAATSNTDFRRGSCSQLSNGDTVRVRGTKGVDGVVAADRIEFR